MADSRTGTDLYTEDGPKITGHYQEAKKLIKTNDVSEDSGDNLSKFTLAKTTIWASERVTASMNYSFK